MRQDWRSLFPGETSLLLFSRLCFFSPFIIHTIQPLIPASLYATHPFAFCSRILVIVFIPPMEIARWSEASFSPTHENSFTPPTIDADLHNRFRSLHISLNERRSPVTPCTTPDHLYPSHQPGKVARGNLLAPIRKHSFNRTKANHSDMVATRFDGSEGRFEGSSIDGLRRHPSQPEMQSGNAATIHARRSSTMSGKNHKAHGELLGQPLSGSEPTQRSKSASSKPLPPSRIPRYTLRTVPPKPSQVANNELRPTVQHVPGSYRSEVDAPADRPLHPSPYEVAGIHTHTGQDSKPLPSAREALEKAQGLGSPLPRDHPYLNQRRGSQTILQSPTSAIRPQTLLASPSGGPKSSQVAEPVLTRDLGQTDSLAEIFESKPPPFQIEDGPEEIPPPQPASEMTTDTISSMQGLASVRPAGNSPRSDGLLMADLLSRLPPSEPLTTSALAEHSLVEKPDNNANREPSLPSVHSLQYLAPSDARRDEILESSPQPKDSANLATVENQKVANASPASRALSTLSEISARSGLRTESQAIELPWGRGHDKPKLEDYEAEENEHWIQKMLRRRSSTAVAPSNLTARPDHHHRRAAAELERTRASMRHDNASRGIEHRPKRKLNSDTTDEASLQHRQEQKGEQFAKVILDLEQLLKEALRMAGKVESKEMVEDRPRPLLRTPAEGYKSMNSTDSATSSDSASSISGCADEEDNITTIPRCHHFPQGKVVTVVEPQGNDRYHGHFHKVRDATPYPASSSAPTRHQSALPPTVNDSGILPNSTNGIPSDRSSKKDSPTQQAHHSQAFDSTDWAFGKPSQNVPEPPQVPPTSRAPAGEQLSFLVRDYDSTQAREKTHSNIKVHHRPSVQPRVSSLRLKESPPIKKGRKPTREELSLLDQPPLTTGSNSEDAFYVADFKNAALQYHPVIRDVISGEPYQAPGSRSDPIQPQQNTTTTPLREDERPRRQASQQGANAGQRDYSLTNRRHFSIDEPHGFSLSRSRRRAPIARDWSTSRKRIVATVTCITTAFQGLIIGIYAGEVPAIQYAIADEHHYAILGNVVFFLGLAITTALFFPLPLLHGRKPYTLVALVLLLVLQFPQALAVNAPRSPYTATYRVGLLLPRAFAGLVMGFANINFKTTLLDLFGSSLQSGNPHQEIVNENDARRHGGGMGVWLGIWTWCSIGSIGVGFLIGAEIISGLDVSWGFWITVILNALVVILNVITPEVRRSAYRRSMAEVRTGTDVSRRIAKGEIKMHLDSTGPLWWGEEVFAGHVICIRMLMQPGFAVLAFYLGWIYGQFVIVIVVCYSRVSSLFSRTDIHTATWRFAISVLPVPPAVRRTISGHHPPRSPSCHPFPEGVLVQSVEASQTKDR